MCVCVHSHKCVHVSEHTCLCSVVVGVWGCLLICMGRETSHTHAHTHTHTTLVRVHMPVLGQVCVELGVSGKLSDWERGRCFTSFSQ